jgi:hypothetical protein
MKNDEHSDPFKVYIRVRPLLERELVIDVDGNNITKPGVLVENGFVIIFIKH